MKSYELEIVWRNQLSSLLINQGYNVFLPVYDAGIDLIAHRESDGDLKLIQQKGRWGIFKKYLGRDIWVAFPHDGCWFVVEHDRMLEWPEVARFLLTKSWIEEGQYHSANPSRALVARFAEDGLGAVTPL